MPAKGDISLKGLVRVLPIIVAFLVILFIIALETVCLMKIVFMVASFFVFFMLYGRLAHRITSLELLKSPCPKCGHSPMRFEPSSQGDYAFICDKCQIEWTMNAPPWRNQ